MADGVGAETANASSNHRDGYAEANGHSSPNGDANISWPLERPDDLTDEMSPPQMDMHESPVHSPPLPVVLYNELLPGHKRSLSGISIRAFLLGCTLGACIPLITIYATRLSPPEPSGAWRVFFLLATLSVFHFLEFWTHARYNVPKAEVASFILFNNGWQYTAANALTLIETAVTSTCFPNWQARFSYPPTQAIALVIMIVGQTCRSMAMAQAGTNFNHKVQTKRRRDHMLVTTGIYGWLRHPSYFGFFWWAVALQVFLGNAICFWIYLLVLWEFFHNRIAHEEQHLVNFFGNEYQRYRSRTWIGIPFV